MFYIVIYEPYSKRKVKNISKHKTTKDLKLTKGKYFFKGEVVKMGVDRIIKVKAPDRKNFKSGSTVVVILGDKLE